MSSESLRSLSVPGDGDAASAGRSDLVPIGPELLGGVKVSLDARLGEAAMTVEELMALRAGAVVPLTTSLADHVNLYLNNILVARGEIVAVSGRFGVRIVELAPSS